MKALAFISILLGLGIVAYLQMDQAKEHDLDKAETQVDQTREKVNDIMTGYEDKMKKLPQ